MSPQQPLRRRILAARQVGTSVRTTPLPARHGRDGNVQRAVEALRRSRRHRAA